MEKMWYVFACLHLLQGEELSMGAAAAPQLTSEIWSGTKRFDVTVLACIGVNIPNCGSHKADSGVSYCGKLESEKASEGGSIAVECVLSVQSVEWWSQCCGSR